MGKKKGSREYLHLSIRHGNKSRNYCTCLVVFGLSPFVTLVLEPSEKSRPVYTGKKRKSSRIYCITSKKRKQNKNENDDDELSLSFNNLNLFADNKKQKKNLRKK
eukprot:UN27897